MGPLENPATGVAAGAGVQIGGGGESCEGGAGGGGGGGYGDRSCDFGACG